MSQTGNGELSFVMTATCPHNMQPVQQAIKQLSLPTRFANSYGLRKYQVANEGCVEVEGVMRVCQLRKQQDEGKRITP